MASSLSGIVFVIICESMRKFLREFMQSSDNFIFYRPVKSESSYLRRHSVAVMMIAKNDTERVDRWVDALSTRRFLSDDSLKLLKGAQIKSMLEELRVSKDIMSLREKGELLSALITRRSSSCAVCMLDFKEKDAYRQTLCGHGFHDECLREWAIKTPNCPTCTCALTAPKRALSDEDTSTNRFSHLFKDRKRANGTSESPSKRRRDDNPCAQQ